MRKKTVSIAMAVYNGEKYLPEQIDSILVQLEEHDELIISYDPSQDGTHDLIREYEKRDKRIKVVENIEHSHGLVSNFENALRNCRNDIIFYSDQDDIWMPGKINRIVQCFSDPGITVAIHDAKLTDEKLVITHESTFKLRGGARKTIIGNLVRLSYIGWCMAFKKEMLKFVLPLPTYNRSHDWWTGCICMKYGKMALVNEQLILHRMHSSNATPKKRGNFMFQIRVRYIIMKNLMKR